MILFAAGSGASLIGDSLNDIIVTGGGGSYVDARSGNDYIDARSSNYASGTILGGLGDDIILFGSEVGTDFGAPPNGIFAADVDGGSGTDRLTVEVGVTRWPYQGLEHRFGDGPEFDFGSSYSDILAGISSGGVHTMITANYAWWNGSAVSWIYARGIELYEYRGRVGNDLFVSWNNNLAAAYGGDGSDALFADWSTTTAAIVWNTTVNNDVERTLGNGVVVQSIERLMLKTGSGNDNIVMGDHSDHVETGAGNDVIITGGGSNYVDAGSGNDVIDARSSNYASGMVPAVLICSPRWTGPTCSPCRPNPMSSPANTLWAEARPRGTRLSR